MSDVVRQVTLQVQGSAEKALLKSSSPGDQFERRQKKKKKEYGSRSRSRERRGSRSKSAKKHKHKDRDHKHKKDHKRKSRSRSTSHKKQKTYRIEGRDRNPLKQDKKKQSAQPTEIPMPLEVEMPPIPIEHRKRQRSRSPLNYYRRNQNNNEGQFWDSFSWVPRMNYTPTVSTSALVNTKKMRRLMITNVPFEIGITEDDLRNLITRYMAQNYLKDEMNNCPVVNLQINETERNVAVELSSVQQTCRICKMEKIELFKGVISGIIRLGDSIYGNNVVTQAQTAAQAQAAAFAAINVLQNKRTQFSVDSLRNSNTSTSTLIRVTNAVTPYMAGQLTKEQWQEYEEDLLDGFANFGTVIHHWFVKKEEKDICADVGNMFLQYETQEQAEKAMSEMQGRIYDERTITLYFIPRDLYYQNFKKGLTPPTLDKK